MGGDSERQSIQNRSFAKNEKQEGSLQHITINNTGVELFKKSKTNEESVAGSQGGGEPKITNFEKKIENGEVGDGKEILEQREENEQDLGQNRAISKVVITQEDEEAKEGSSDQSNSKEAQEGNQGLERSEEAQEAEEEVVNKEISNLDGLQIMSDSERNDNYSNQANQSDDHPAPEKSSRAPEELQYSSNEPDLSRDLKSSNQASHEKEDGEEEEGEEEEDDIFGYIGKSVSPI